MRAHFLADSLPSWQPFADTLPALRRLGSRYRLGILSNVDDDLIAEGMRFLAQRAKLVAEPAGAAATGALLAGKIAVRPGERVVSIVSGGNVDLARMAQLFGA